MPIENPQKKSTMPSCIGQYSLPIPPNNCKICDDETQTICIETTKRNKNSVAIRSITIDIPKPLYAVIEFYKEPHETMNGHILELIREGINTTSEKAWKRKTTKNVKP
jgi:hypothetical protein